VTEEHVTEQHDIPNDEKRDMFSGQDTFPDDEKLDEVFSGQTKSMNTSVRMLQARYMLEMVYGHETAKVVLAGKLLGLDPQLSKGRFVKRWRFGRGIVLWLVEQVWQGYIFFKSTNFIPWPL
jgi:hypothetical protein